MVSARVQQNETGVRHGCRWSDPADRRGPVRDAWSFNCRNL